MSKFSTCTKTYSFQMTSALSVQQSNSAALLFLLLSQKDLAAIAKESTGLCQLAINFRQTEEGTFGLDIESLILKTTVVASKKCMHKNVLFPYDQCSFRSAEQLGSLIISFIKPKRLSRYRQRVNGFMPAGNKLQAN